MSGDAPLTPRERLLRALTGAPVDRVPVICTGGSMSAVPAEVVERSGYSLPAAHSDPAAMAGLALAAAHLTGFECVGVPLCTTIEAAAFEAEIDLGDARTEARVVREPYASIRDVQLPSLESLLAHPRVGVTVAAVERLAATAGDLPILANLIGPVSVAASVVEPTAFLREVRTRPAEVAALVERATDFLIAWAERLRAAGADVIVVHEDTTTPALVGPRTFERSVAPHLTRLFAAISAGGGQSLLHMCGALGASAATVAGLGCHGFIADAALAPADLRDSLPGLAVVGNLSSFLLHLGGPEDIGRIAARLAGPSGVAVLSPTCGLSSLTPLSNILAMTAAAGASARSF